MIDDRELKEVIDARVWSGIHFRTADVQGAILGKKVGSYLCARPPPALWAALAREVRVKMGTTLSFDRGDPAFAEEPRLSLLAACPLFAVLPERVLRELACLARRRTYEAEQVLFHVGDPSESAYVLCSGHVQARIRSSEGRELVLHVSVPGEAPGYLDLIDGAPRSVDAVAQDDVEVLMLPARAVRKALIEHPSALMELSTGLAGIIRKLDELMRDLVFLDLPARLAKLLLARPAAGHRVELGVTQGELAAQLGVTRQSLNRALGDLQRRGLIRVEESGTAVELLNRVVLRRLAVGARPPLSHM